MNTRKLKSISARSLVDAYLDAVKMKLDKEFIRLLLTEIQDREIDIRNVTMAPE